MKKADDVSILSLNKNSHNVTMQYCTNEGDTSNVTSDTVGMGKVHVLIWDSLFHVEIK